MKYSFDEQKLPPTIREAFDLIRKNHLLELAISPLAKTELIRPHLPKQDTHSHEEIAEAVKALLRWATQKLCPDNKLPDKETWLDPEYHSFNILHGFYFEKKTLASLAELMETTEQNISQHWRNRAFEDIAIILRDKLNPNTIQNVQAAFELIRKGHLLELATSPLAKTKLIESYFEVGQNRSPDAIAAAVKAALSWAVQKLYPDDKLPQEKIWLDIKYRNFNILHHFYFKRMSAALLAKNMATSEQNIAQHWRPDAFEAVVRILDELIHKEEFQKYALLEKLKSLTKSHWDILNLVAVFRHPMPTKLFYEWATEAALTEIHQNLLELMTKNLILADTSCQNLLIQPEIRGLLPPLSIDKAHNWYSRAANYYYEQQDYLETAQYFRWTKNFDHAATVISMHYQDIIANFETEWLLDILQEFKFMEISEANLWANLKLIHGEILEDLENLDAAIEQYQQAISTALHIQTKVKAYYRSARAYRFTKPDISLSQYQRAIELLTKEDPFLPQVYIGRAWVFLQERQDLVKAEADLKYAESLIRPEQIALQADLHNTWGQLHSWHNQFELAKEHRLRAWILAKEVDDIERKVRISNNLGQDYIDLKDYDQAIEYLQQSVDLAERTEFRKSEGLGYKFLGACYYWKQEYYQAIEYYQQALIIFEETKNLVWQASASYDLAESYIELNKWFLAYYFYLEAQRIAQEINDVSLVNCLAELSKSLPALTTKHKQILQLAIKQNGRVTKKECVELLNLSDKSVVSLLNELVEYGLFTREGKGPNTHYLANGFNELKRLLPPSTES